MSIARALISVSDKLGIVEFARFLSQKNIEILSTGGTAKILRENAIPVKDIAEYTGFPEMLDGRVKTLHPKVHGGLLFLRGNPEHEKTAKEHGIDPIDLVVVNLYPFAEVLKKEHAEESELIENIDIGGPSMIRSAAKNFESVTVITDPNDYLIAQAEIEKFGDTLPETRRYFMSKAFLTTAKYDAMIAETFRTGTFTLFAHEVAPLRYGENPHQMAHFYETVSDFASLSNAKKIQGKALSYNNILDADAAFKSIAPFTNSPACAIIKHLSPCGIAVGETLEISYEKALAGDSVSAFGGVVAFSGEVSEALAQKCSELFLEIILAPKFSEAAKQVFAQKENLRILEISPFSIDPKEKDVRSVLGGILVQETDQKIISANEIQVVTKKKLSPSEMDDLVFAFNAVKSIKSNAILIAKNKASVGIGGGLTSRVDASELAVKKAGSRAKGAVAASDAFFPFADAVEALAKAGITAIIQPGGAKKDDEVIAKCDEMGIAMAFTGVRAFRH
jgi:phosphoribosylaminoimidazolecarboxamide formyltransferase / IMP cyclohydrolase